MNLIICKGCVLKKRPQATLTNAHFKVLYRRNNLFLITSVNFCNILNLFHGCLKKNNKIFCRKNPYCVWRCPAKHTQKKILSKLKWILILKCFTLKITFIDNISVFLDRNHNIVKNALFMDVKEKSFKEKSFGWFNRSPSNKLTFIFCQNYLLFVFNLHKNAFCIYSRFLLRKLTVVVKKKVISSVKHFKFRIS